MAKNSTSFVLFSEFIPTVKMYWIIIIAMLIAVLCMCACAVYACIGDKNEDNSPVASCNGNDKLHKIKPPVGKY